MHVPGIKGLCEYGTEFQSEPSGGFQPLAISAGFSL
jgi:hypothetical protein